MKAVGRLRARSARREGGSALFLAVLMLALMGAIGIAALDTATRDRQSAGYQNRAESAFWAAEAGAAEGRAQVRLVNDWGATPAMPSQSSPAELGDDSLYDREGELPVYYGDPAFTNPIARAGIANFPVPGSPDYAYSLWRINVVGESAGAGAPARIEVIETRVLQGSPGGSTAY